MAQAQMDAIDLWLQDGLSQAISKYLDAAEYWQHWPDWQCLSDLSLAARFTKTRLQVAVAMP